MRSRTMTEYLPIYEEYLSMIGYSEDSVLSLLYSVRKFVTWCEERSLFSPRDITEDHLMQYQRAVYLYRKVNGEPISTSYQQMMISSVKGFFRFFRKRKVILFNPSTELVLPRTPPLPPKQILTHEEVERVLNVIPTDHPLGIRNRTILEVLYSTGIRRRELQKLEIKDVDLQARIVDVLFGKGGTRRRIPIGERACHWVERYLIDARPNFVRGNDSGVLFISRRGTPLCKEVLGRIARKYLDEAGIEKAGRCHQFRHAMATGMMDNGADIRHIQKLLGHKRINSTQIYTHVSIKKLKEIHEKTHPARMEGMSRFCLDLPSLTGST